MSDATRKIEEMLNQILRFCTILNLVCPFLGTPMRNAFSPPLVPTSTLRKLRVIVIAVNIEMRIPRARLTANPLIIELPKYMRIAQVMSDEKLESRMELQARSNPTSMALAKGRLL